MKGIILAGGRATRLYPTTLMTPKSCLPVYNKPMIYYPLSILMLSNIKEIVIICDPQYEQLFKNIIKNFELLGLDIQVRHQHQPNGIAESFIICEDFIGDDDVCLVLGDNFLFGGDLPERLTHAKESIEKSGGAHIFGFGTKNPSDFGIATIKDGNVIDIEEKPKNPKSNWAIIGVYMYDKNVCKFAKQIRKSARGELEITDLNRVYLDQNQLKITQLGRGFTWFDMGTHDNMLDACNFVRSNIMKYMDTLHSSNSDYYDYVKNLINS